MSGLRFKKRRDIDSKPKKSTDFAPVNITISSFITSDEHDELFQKFADATSKDEQLPILSKIVDLYEGTYDINFIKFMAVVYLQAEAEHPVKCFISRYVTQNKTLQKSFTSVLASQISGRISTEPTDHREYIDVVSKVATCIENFSASVAAVRIVEIELTSYLTNSLNVCVDLLGSYSLTTAVENDIFNLSHLTLRLLLHIVLKADSESLHKLMPMFPTIAMWVEDLMINGSVPLETKSMCGIIYIYMYVIENGPDSFLDIFDPETCSDDLSNLLLPEASELCLYSALATVVSVDRLEAVHLNGNPAILTVLAKMLEIDERTALKSVKLSAARTVHQISKCLEKIKDRAIGLKIVDSLIMYGWSHLDDHLDTVARLTSQMLNLVLIYCINLKIEDDNKKSSDNGSGLSESKPSNEIQKDAVPAEEMKEQKTKEVVFNVETEKKERKIEN